MTSQNVLFYSNRCAHSKELISELYKAGLIEAFAKVCVDNNPNVPRGITSVPTMVVSRYPRPLKGQECFMWLQGIKQQQDTQQAHQSGQIMPGSTGAPSGNAGGVHVTNRDSGETNAMAGSNGIPGFQDLLPFSDTMGGFSDGYSFISDERPMEHQFAFLDGQFQSHQPQHNGNIQTPQEVSHNDKQSELSQALDRLKEARAREMGI